MKRGLFAILLAIALIFSLGGQAVASTKYVIVKEDTWSSVQVYPAYNNVGTGMHLEKILVTTTVDYLWWPDGANVNKLAPFMTQVCYNFLDTPGAGLQNVWTRPYYFDDNTDVLQAKVVVSNDPPRDHRCHSEAIPVANRTWLRMDQSPGWMVDGHLSLTWQTDQNWEQEWGGSKIKYFHPDQDPSIGDWYYENNADWGQ